MDESTSHEARADAFPLTRKGYDRRQVDAYREAAEERIDALEQQIQSLENNMSELGLARPTDLAAELDVVGEEVKRVLQEARVAAEQMRSRAADDAARWRAEADEESRDLRASSRAVAYEARRSVWQTGSEMLASAVEVSEAVTVAATERALFTQAEAEREASHLVGDARRERDESVGGAREEAERLVAAARQESESVISAARRQADAAQERAKALELRRAELMVELETARATIAGNDVASGPDVVPEEPIVDDVETADVVEAAEDVRSHWLEDEGSVKIVSAARVMTTEPVDADAMVAEVEAMRKSESDQLPAASPQPDPEGEPELEKESEPDPEADSASVPSAEGRGDAEELSDDAGGRESDQQPAASLQPEIELEPSSFPSEGIVAVDDGERQSSDQLPAAGDQSESKPHSSPSGGGVGEGDGGGQAVLSEDTEVREPEPENEQEPVPKPDPLAGLFARLRDPADTEASSAEASSSSSGGVAAAGDGGGQSSDQLPDASDQSEPEPEPELDREPASSPSGGRGAEGNGGGQSSDQLPAASDQPESEPSLDPFALRERHLLPVQNRALRSVKRSLVEAQNQALEDLRLVDGWEPDESIVRGEISDALAVLARESMVAGFAAAAEMMDTTETPHPDNVDAGDPSSEFAGALIEAARGSVVRSRGAGAGHREIASALSRVFRSWRTDEAERRVQFASRAAYHIGVTAALADLAATDLEVIASGRPCRECPANKGPWAIADGLPSGTMMPPARIECACVIVPSR